MQRDVRLSLVILLALAVYEASTLSPFVFKAFRDVIPKPQLLPRGYNNAEKYDTVEEKFMDQKLDHFNPENPGVWNMRYYENLDNFADGGPIMLFLGGEWAAVSPGWIQTGNFYDVGVELKGAMYYIEHRFYGKSQPTNDTANYNLRYLNAEQQLADIANFIVQLKQLNPNLSDSKVLITGSGSAGNLAVWFRQKYPELVNGVWAADAYLYAKVDFEEYKVGTGYAIRKAYGDNCYRRVEQAFSEMANLVLNERVGRLNTEFDLCQNITTRDPLNLSNFFYTLANFLSFHVEFNRGPFTIKAACDIITDSNYTDGLAGYGAFIRSLNGGNCFHANYDEEVFFLRHTNWTDPANSAGSRSLFYQSCNEFGQFPSSGHDNQPFGNLFPLELYYKMCYDAFFTRFRRDFINGNIEYSNDLYGGFNPAVTNVYFTLGELDPAHVLGIQRPLTEKTFAFVIPGMSAFTDLDSISDDDTYELRLTKKRVSQLFKMWISSDDNPLSAKKQK